MDNSETHKPSVAVEQIDYYPKGQSDPTPRPGDFILTHGQGFYGTLIRIGQALQFRGADAKYAHFNHAALVVSGDGDLIEALGNGVVISHLSKYFPKEYCVVRVDASDEDRQQMVEFARRCVGRKYGWLHIASLALTLLCFNKIDFGVKDEMICSGLVAGAQERGWAYFDDCDHVMPADLAKMYTVEANANRN